MTAIYHPDPANPYYIGRGSSLHHRPERSISDLHMHDSLSSAIHPSTKAWLANLQSAKSSSTSKQRKVFLRPTITEDLFHEVPDAQRSKQRSSSGTAPATPTPASRGSTRAPLPIGVERPSTPSTLIASPMTHVPPREPAHTVGAASLSQMDTWKRSPRSCRAPSSCLQRSDIAKDDDSDADTSTDDDSLHIEKSGHIEILIEYNGHGRKLIADCHLVRAVVQQWTVLNHRFAANPNNAKTAQYLEKSTWNVLTLKCVLLELNRTVALAVLGRFMADTGLDTLECPRCSSTGPVIHKI